MDDDLTIHDNPLSPSLDAYAIQSRRQIVSYLRSLNEKKIPLVIGANSQTDVATTVILEVDEDNGLLVIRRANDQEFNKRLQDGSVALFESELDRVRILFAVHEIGECLYEDRMELSIPIPDRIVRIQRREFYRINTPVLDPVLCTVNVPNGVTTRAVTLPMRNISLGGVQLSDARRELNVMIGLDYPHCWIKLPTGETFDVTLQVRNHFELPLKNGGTERRVGFQFIGLSKRSETAVQLYINELERKLKSKGLN